MMTKHQKTPDPKEIEKELSDFISKRFGNNVKIVSPITAAQVQPADQSGTAAKHPQAINFNMTPEALIAYLDQYVVKQDHAKAVLATKICTHFNRIARSQESGRQLPAMVGSVKNNVLMIGPTGVGKTYLVKLIAHKLGVPFVKGDATKFSETGYVGGDVEDLVRDLVRAADDDLERAQFGIIYIDEIDKIASGGHRLGIDVSRTGVQRALLKPLEETEVDLKVPHDPISMIQEVEHFRKTGQREKRSINTRNILFIVSGAFNELTEIIHKRVNTQSIGFGSSLNDQKASHALQSQVKSEDLIQFGFESEFVGRLPVRAILGTLTQNDLYEILRNPNNPIILGKRMDFAAYGIRALFSEQALRWLAKRAYAENTGARGLVSAVEEALLLYEKRLPSLKIPCFPVTHQVVESPQQMVADLEGQALQSQWEIAFARLEDQTKAFVSGYLADNRRHLSDKHALALTPSRIEVAAAYYVHHAMDLGQILDTIKSNYDDVKKMELTFFQTHDLNIVFEEDAIDFIIEQIDGQSTSLEDFYQTFDQTFEPGLNLIRERTARSRFFIGRDALESPDDYIHRMLKTSGDPEKPPESSA